jgi:hypothetical protein
MRAGDGHAGGASRRQVVDLATVAFWPPGEADKVERYLRKELRLTDEIVRSAAGLRALLTGCDELGTTRALRRVPVPPAQIRLATTTDVLRGADEDCPE